MEIKENSEDGEVTEQEKVWKAIKECKEGLEKEKEKSANMEKKVNELEKKVKMLINDKSILKEKLQNNEEDKIQLLDKIEKVKKYATDGLDKCVEYVTEENRILEHDIGRMLVTILDCIKKEKEGIRATQENSVNVEEIFLHELKRDRAFRVTKGNKWHPEMCAMCLLKNYLREDLKYKIYKAANVKGCIWIQFEEERGAWNFAREAAEISYENVLVIKEVPTNFCDLIKLLEEEQRWCSHKNSF